MSHSRQLLMPSADRAVTNEPRLAHRCLTAQSVLPRRTPKISTMLCLLLLCSCAISPLLAQTTGSITGRIEPTHDHEFTQATATLPALGQRVAVAGDGTFRFERVRAGSHLLRVQVPTLGIAVERIEVTAGQETEIVVEVQPGSHFEEVVVSAPGEVRDSLELANAVTTLSGEELLQRVEATLGETLANEAGVSSTFFGPGSSRPIIRGLGGDRVRMLEDGTGSGDASDISADHAVTIDPLQAERIEVLRGPATLLYGSSAVGGVVNVIDERIPSTRATRAAGGTFDLRLGSAADERVGSLNLGGGGGDWAWNVNVLQRETDDYEIPGFANVEDDDHEDEHEHEHDEEEEEENPFGIVPNSDLETSGVRVGATRFFGERGSLGIAISGLDTQYGIPGGGHGHEEEEEHHDEGEEDEDEHDEEEEEVVRIDMEQRRLDLRGRLDLLGGPFQALRARIAANDYEHVELEGSEVGTRFFNDSLEGRLELAQRPRGALSGSLGLQFSDRDLEAIGAEAFVPPSQSTRWAAFTFQEVERGPLTWQFGARFETQDSDASGDVARSVSHDGLSGSLGLVWRLAENWAIASSVSRSVKLPAVEELFANGPHIATRAFEIGDPNLEEETGLGIDLSLRRTQGRLTGELTLFRQDFDDFIFQAFTGDEEDGLPVVEFRQQDAEFQGAELSARLELWERNGHHLHLRVVGDMVDAELNDGSNLPRIPPRSLGTGLHYHSERWNAMVEVRDVDDQDEVAANEEATAGYTFLNASLGYRFIFGGRIVDLLLRGRNLTDEEARVHTSFLKESVPLPGRDVSLSARFWF